MHANLLTTIGWPLLFISLLELVLGVLLLTHNTRNSSVHTSVAAFSFFTAAFSLITSLMYIFASFGRDITPLARANWVGWLMIPAALQFIFYIRDENSRTARVAGYILYPFWILVLVVSMSTSLIEPGNYTLIPYLDRSGPLAKPLRLAGILQLLWVLVEIYRLRRRIRGIRRAQLNYFTLGLLIFACGGMFISGILPLFGGFGLEPGLGSYFSLPWVALTFYAMTRYRLFDLRSIISRLASVGLLFSVFAVVQIGLFKLLEPLLGASPAIAVSLPVIGVLFFGTPFSLKIHMGIQHIILRDKFDYQRILQESIRAIITILDTQRLLIYLVQSIKTSLGVGNVCLFLKDEHGVYAQQQGIAGSTEKQEERILSQSVVAWVLRNRTVMLREELEGTLPDEDFCRLDDSMKQKEVEIVIPLFYDEQLKGVLTLGPKGNQEPYAPSDIDLLEALAGHAAVALENARLYHEALHARESLQESETKFRALAQMTPAAIVIHRGEKVLYANPVAAVMTGYTHEEFLSRALWEIAHPEFRSMVREWGRIHPASDRDPPQYEFKIIRKDGAERWVLMTADRLDYEGLPSVIGILLDITERKALEGELRYAQKMEAIGKLAGGVAHDFNNIITAIIGYANILLMKLGKDDPSRGHVNQILASTERASNLTKSLLAFGKKQAVNLRSGDLNRIVRGAEKLLASLGREGIGLSFRYQDGSLPVLVDAVQIERIVMNLMVNARDAMPDGGTVTIETRTAELDNEFIGTYGYGREGTYAVVALTDTGIGMDKSVKERIFEPFFTTKGYGKGTGFGLSIVYDAVKEHHGYVTVDSEPGAGTTFTVYLPLDTAAAHGTQPLITQSGNSV